MHAHSNILRIRSQYFCAELSKERPEMKDGKFILRKPNIPPHLFEMILRFIYCGKIDLEKLQESDILRLLIIVNELNIFTLVNHIQKYMINHHDEFLQKNPVGVLETVYQKENFTDILNLSLKKIYDLQSANLGYSNGVKSVGGYGNNGPVFGGGSDLDFYKGTWYSHINSNCSYPKIGIPAGGFKADDYEVFQVIKK
ncbi:unnamed protein product [Rhizophagus irregularis]|nr:unnamed protein product [Rhizophagus irregularis]